MKQKIRTPIKLIILTALMLGLSVTSAFAAEYNGSTVKGTSSCGSGSFENTASGYRIYICNPDGSLASNVVDIQFSKPSSYKQSYYNNCKTNTWFVCESIKRENFFYNDPQGYKSKYSKTILVNQIKGLKGTMPKPIDVSSTGAGKSLVPKGGELKSFLRKTYTVNGKKVEMYNLRTILNARTSSGAHLFNYLDGRKPTKDMDIDGILNRDGGYVCIEPIFWCVPQGIKNGQALSFNCVFYGTTTNYAQFAKAVNLGDGGNGGWLQQIFGKYGLTTLYIGLDDDSLKADKMKVFRLPQKVGGVYCPIKGIIGRKYVLQEGSNGGLPGYAMHYVVIDGENPKDRTHTYDKEIPNKPHPAPEISEKKITEDTKKNGDDPEKRIFQYRIIKVYEEQDKDGTRKHKITTVRDSNPGEIAIEHEKDYKVIGYYTTELEQTAESTTTWKQLKDEANPTTDKNYAFLNGSYDKVKDKPAGTVIKTVTIGTAVDEKDSKYKDDRTLVVRLLKKEQPEDENTPALGEIDNIITESQISKAITTAKAITSFDGTGDYKIESIIDKNDIQHPYIVHKSCKKHDHCGNVSSTCSRRLRQNLDHSVSATFKGTSPEQLVEADKVKGRDADFSYFLKSGSEKGKKITLLNSNNVGDGSYKKILTNDYTKDGTGISGQGGIAYFTTIWRTGDKLTLANYKQKAMDKDTISRLKSLGIGIKNSTSSRYDNHSGERKEYTRTMKIAFGSSGKDLDKYTQSMCIANHCCGADNIKSDKMPVRFKVNGKSSDEPQINFSGDILIQVYSGKEHKSTAAATPKLESGFNVQYEEGVSDKSTFYYQQLDKDKNKLSFYPYIRMSYAISADAIDNNKYNTVTKAKVGDFLKYRTAYILSDKKTSILPSNAVELSWFNDNDAPLQLTSQQWSTHNRATNGENGWNLPGQVLPGGAIYFLSTKGTETMVKTVTYNAMTAGEDWISGSDSSVYQPDNIRSRNNKYIKELRKNIENLRIVQWVNRNTGADAAWGGSENERVKIGQDQVGLGNLGLNNKTSKESKYKLYDATDNNSHGAAEADLDIVGEVYQTVVYKAFSDTEGNIYLTEVHSEKSHTPTIKDGELENLRNKLKNVNGTNCAGLEPIGTKDDSLQEILDNNPDVAELDAKTKIITNLVNAVTRNKGDDDNNFWVNDEKWYNEAFDGIMVVKRTSYMKVGLGIPSLRTAALNPNLCPKSNGKGDIFTKAFLSQFCVDDKNNKMATFDTGNGEVTVKMKDLKNMFTSKKFYIPNANVQDLS